MSGSRNILRRRFGRTARALLVLTLVLGPVAHAAAGLTVVLEKDNERHQTVLQSFRQAIEAAHSGGKATPTLRVIDTAEVMQEKTGAGNPDPRLTVTIGTRAAETVFEQPGEAQVLSVFLPEVAYRELTASAPHGSRGRTTGAVVLDQPLARQLAIARTLLPDAKRVGALLSREAVDASQAFAAAASRFGLDANPMLVGPQDDPADGIEQLVRESDVLIAIYDHRIFRPVTAKWMLYIAFQERLPIVGFSYALLKAGAAAAVYSTPAQIGLHAAEQALSWLEGKVTPGIQHPRYYNVAINGPVADALGIPVPDEEAFAASVRARLEAQP
jgi:ABC-type uncharacterized transport system substrate-binding protein